MKKIRVLVIDDSVFLRRNIPRILESDPQIEVVGAAADGAEGLCMIQALHPDVVTLDILMPVMDGLTALKHIMRQAPTPVIIVSSTTYQGTRETLEALSLGAVDFITKPSGPVSLDIQKIRRELIEKVKIAYASKVQVTSHQSTTREKFGSSTNNALLGQTGSAYTARPKLDNTSYQESKARSAKRLVAIATSTGGPAALQVLLSQLPANLQAGLMIIQHIAPGFTTALAQRLDSLSALTVREAQNGAVISPGTALVAPAGLHLTIERIKDKLMTRLRSEPADTLHRPSADVLFNSIANCCALDTCAVILTGMGEDGALGMRSIHERGGWTIAQDEATSVVYGMPRRALELNGVDTCLPLERIAAEILRVTLQA